MTIMGVAEPQPCSDSCNNAQQGCARCGLSFDGARVPKTQLETLIRPTELLGILDVSAKPICPRNQGRTRSTFDIARDGQHELCDVRVYLRALEGFREQRN